MKQGIYRIRNKINGDCYYGSAINFSRRLSNHRSDLRRNKHHSPHMQNAWNKYGEENFAFEPMFEIKNKELLLVFEQVFLELPNAVYNTLKNARSPLGRKHTEETKEKIRIHHLGNKYALGHKLSDEVKQQISNKKKGIPQTEEACKNISKSLIGNKRSLGFKHSEESLRKRSESRRKSNAIKREQEKNKGKD